ncbi:MAG: cysteine-rich CWC family protein [Leptospiraceae bacterium]|nr:cysteine-rich CWC family protein [Leptospiraceae bacterium]
MSKTKQCPKCNQPFECKSDAIQECGCASIQLKPEHLDYIASHFKDCLCPDCLKEISQS